MRRAGVPYMTSTGFPQKCSFPSALSPSPTFHVNVLVAKSVHVRATHVVSHDHLSQAPVLADEITARSDSIGGAAAYKSSSRTCP